MKRLTGCTRMIGAALAALMLAWTLPVQAMNKAELIEAMASHAGLSLSPDEAAETIDAFTGAVTKQLSSGDGKPLALSGFGAFRVIPGMDAHGRVSGGNVEFVAGRAFHGSDEPSADPFTMTVARIGGPGDLGSDGDGLPDLTDDDLFVFGDGTGSVQAGDVTVVNDPPRGNPGRGRGREPREAEVVTVLVEDGDPCCLAIDIWEGRSAGLVLRGIDKRDIRRGMQITTSPDQPGDEHIVLEELSRQLDVKDQEVINRYIVLLTLIADEVNAGGFVDLGGFGRFAQEAQATVQVVDPCPGDPEVCLELVEHEVGLSVTGDDPDTVAAMASSISKRSARTGRNPQTGKEIKIAAKNKVKFKAGAELSGQVN